MKHGAMMKSMCAGMFVLGVLAVCAVSARADDWQRVAGGSSDVEVYVKKEPKILGGVRIVQLKFVNRSDYNINLTYTAIISCPIEGSKDAATGRSFVRRHDYYTTSFSYIVCAKDSADDSSRIEVRVKYFGK